jgi:hypothetical protein
MLATGKNCQLKFPLAADLEGGRHSALLVLSSAIALCNNARAPTPRSLAVDFHPIIIFCCCNVQ